MVLLSPSLVSAPLTCLKETVSRLEEAGADMLHFDLEDGSFVPVMNLGTRLIEELRPLTRLPFDVHLMMVNPEWLIPELARMGVQRVSVHYEACEYPRRTLGLIAQHGMQPGLAFNPKTPLPEMGYLRPFLSFVLVLTTEPEAGHCAYLPEVLEKVRAGRAQAGLEGVQWQVDGGITAANAAEVIRAGADILVSGRGVFHGDIRENIRAIKAAAA
ncbi:MAG TPA: ribulose-phosphate 3-epimerase [Chloroflexi bacterium]|jgi:ribulose-phosphate 3-epimerase|nr:ribulose-phosphate 3-epimerase [Chloroflexota bacterium]